MASQSNQLSLAEQMDSLTKGEIIDCLAKFLSEKQELKFHHDDYRGALANYFNQVKTTRKEKKRRKEGKLAPITDKLKGNVKPAVIGIIIVVVLATGFTFGLLKIFTPPLTASTMPVHAGTLLTFLGFVVALAAYLATVARGLKEKLADLNESLDVDAHDYEKQSANYKKHAENLMKIIRAEALLVGIGTLVVGRIIVSPLVNPANPFDYFLIVYISLTIIYLGYLHARQWTYHAN
jgi:hypothetical protein